MISRIEGIAAEIESDGVIVMVGGLGLKVYTPQPLLNEIEAGKPIALRTHLIVKEDLLALYGFATEDELNMFTLLLGVSGVGPKLALSILSNSTTDAIRRAVIQEQPDFLARIPGLGKKTVTEILNARKAGPFKDFEDLKTRVPMLKDPVKLITDRIILEISDRERRHYIFIVR